MKVELAVGGGKSAGEIFKLFARSASVEHGASAPIFPLENRVLHCTFEEFAYVH